MNELITEFLKVVGAIVLFFGIFTAIITSYVIALVIMAYIARSICWIISLVI